MFLRCLIALSILVAVSCTPPEAEAHEASPRTEAIAQVTGHRSTPSEIRFCRLTGGGAPFIACLHATEGHRQWLGGSGTPGHTWANYRAQADRLRRFITALTYPTCTGPSDCPALIRRAFDRQGIGHLAEAGVAVAACESGFNPRAYNPSGASGLFQQLASYWPGRAAAYGFAGASPFDPWANAMVSAGMVRDTGGFSHWVCQP